jgi:putative ABC transport system substrate-binding protein
LFVPQSYRDERKMMEMFAAERCDVPCFPLLEIANCAAHQPSGRQHHRHVSLTMLMDKHMELVHELVPDAKTIAVLVTWQYNLAAELAKEEAREPAAAPGVQILFLMAGSEHEIEAAFAAMNQHRAEALIVVTSPFFVTRAKLIASLAGR